jgi:hypothetical protein
MNLYFYVVENENKTLKSFILVSKYNLYQIKNLYKKFNKKLPNIQYLFDKKNKTINKKIYNNKTKRIRKII